jgi:hypothetical protein
MNDEIIYNKFKATQEFYLHALIRDFYNETIKFVKAFGKILHENHEYIKTTFDLNPDAIRFTRLDSWGMNEDYGRNNYAKLHNAKIFNTYIDGKCQQPELLNQTTFTSIGAKLRDAQNIILTHEIKEIKAKIYECNNIKNTKETSNTTQDSEHNIKPSKLLLYYQTIGEKLPHLQQNKSNTNIIFNQKDTNTEITNSKEPPLKVQPSFI